MLDNVIFELIQSARSPIRSSSDEQKISEQLDEYIASQHRKFKFSKSSLFRDEPVDFYRSYIPLTLYNKSLNINSDEPLYLLEKYKRLIVIGGAGSGKTTLLRHLALAFIERGAGIPVSIDLRGYDSSKEIFANYIAKLISYDFITEVKSFFGKGKFVFIMDGFDEIRYDRDEIYITQIQEFVDKYSDDKFIISSRPGTNIQSLSSFYVLNIAKLDEYSIHSYLNTLSIPNSVKYRILEGMDSDTRLKEMLATPLLISLYAISLSEHNTEISDKKSIYFRVVLDSLLSKHDAVSKLGYIREKLSGLSKDEIESAATTLAFRAFSSSKYHFSKDDLYKEFQIIKRINGIHFENEKFLYDLVITVNIIVEDNNLYYFQHIMLLEYLAALFIARLDESKPKFYSKLVNNSKVRISASFLDFINELDSNSFKKYYLIPTLELVTSFNNPLHEENSESLIQFLKSHYFKNDYYVEPYQIIKLTHTLKNELESIMDDDFDILFGI